MNFLEEIRLSTGMDANAFYSALVTLLTVILPFIVAIFKSFRNKIENNLWDLHVSGQNEFFYLYILLLEMLFALLSAFIVYFIQIVMTSLEVEVGLLYLIIFVILTLVSMRVVSRMSFVKKRLLGNNKHRWLIYLPIILYNINMYTILLEIENSIWNFIITFAIFVLELLGMWFFRIQYIQYQYASAIFYLSNGDKIDCKDISKIARRYNSLIIKENDMQIRVKYDDISRVKYYGGVRIQFLDKKMSLKMKGFDNVDIY